MLEEGEGWKINKFMVAKLSFPPYYVTEVFSSFVYVPCKRDERVRERKSEGKMNGEELDLNPSFRVFSVYSFIQMPFPKRETKFEDFTGLRR